MRLKLKEVVGKQLKIKIVECDEGLIITRWSGKPERPRQHIYSHPITLASRDRLRAFVESQPHTIKSNQYRIAIEIHKEATP